VLYDVLVDTRRAGACVLLDNSEQVAEKRAFFVVERGGRPGRLGARRLVDRGTIEAGWDRCHEFSLALRRAAKAV
jgi:hypothetical protein